MPFPRDNAKQISPEKTEKAIFDPHKVKQALQVSPTVYELKDMYGYKYSAEKYPENPGHLVREDRQVGSNDL